MANVRVAFQLHGHRDSMTASQWRSIRKQRSSGGDLKPLTTATSTDNPTSRDEIGYPPLPKKQKHGPKVLRIVGGWLARNRSGPGKKAFHSLEEPVSSVAVAQVTPQMSRANSLISRDNTEPETENEEEEIVDIGHRKRVSFDMDVMVSANSEIQVTGSRCFVKGRQSLGNSEQLKSDVSATFGDGHVAQYSDISSQIQTVGTWL